MRPSTTRVHDQRWTDREFRALVRPLQPPSPAVRAWRAAPTAASDVRLTPHHDRRSIPTVLVVAGSLAFALTGILSGDVGLAVAMSLAGLAACAVLGSDQARTSLTITEDGRVEVANGVHRRITTVPAVAVARISVPRRVTSRWDPRRLAGELLLHNGDRIPVRALAHDPSRPADLARAVYLARAAVQACQDAGAALDTRRV